jgi:hypothetical protein
VNPAIAVQIRSSFPLVVQCKAHRAIPRSITCPLYFDGPKMSGYQSLVQIQSARTPGSSSVAEHSRIVPCPSRFVAEEPWQSPLAINHKPGGRMAHHDEDQEEPMFEITSKRRKGFTSESRVKRGKQIVHGEKELIEKLGRNDPCPCGSARRF